MRRFAALAAVALIGGVVAGCGPTGGERVNGGESNLKAYRDEVRGVTCYRVIPREGLSCIADAQREGRP